MGDRKTLEKFGDEWVDITGFEDVLRLTPDVRGHTNFWKCDIDGCGRDAFAVYFFKDDQAEYGETEIQLCRECHSRWYELVEMKRKSHA